MIALAMLGSMAETAWKASCSEKVSDFPLVENVAIRKRAAAM